MDDDIVITGLGAVTPIGEGAEEFWQNLVAGISGANSFEADELDDFPVNVICDVKEFNPVDYMTRKEARLSSRSTQFALTSTRQALADADIEIGSDVAPERMGIVMNTGGGGIIEAEIGTRALMAKGPRAVSPFMVPRGMPNAVSSAVAMSLGVKGPALTSTLACASGSYAVVQASQMLQRGEADVIVAGGCESVISTVYMAGLARMGALSKWPGDPAGASRPFDAERSGFVFGEGGAAMVLEREEHAQRRGVTIYAKVLGGSMTNDAFHITAPDPGGEGAIRAILLALEDAGLEVTDVEVIFAHGTSTPLNDVTETKAIKTALGEHAYSTPISATKSMIGHTMGAAGAISAVAAVQGLHYGLVPPTINYMTPDPDCDLDYTPLTARSLAHQTSMINAFGFGGHNVVLLLGAYDRANGGESSN